MSRACFFANGNVTTHASVRQYHDALGPLVQSNSADWGHVVGPGLDCCSHLLTHEKRPLAAAPNFLVHLTNRLHQGLRLLLGG